MSVQHSTQNLYSNFNHLQFRVVASLLCLMGDVALMRYIYLRLTSDQFLETFYRLFFDRMRQELGTDTQQAIAQMGGIENFHIQLHQLLVHSLTLSFVAIILIQMLTYAFYIVKKSRRAFLYIRFMAWVGVPMFLFIGIQALDLGPLGVYMFLQVIFYFFVIYGLKHFFIENPKKLKSKTSEQ